jgi:selenocysteine lyase/cysteine desulfurase
MGVLYGKRELLSLLANQSHYFLPEDDFQRRLCPGGLNYELTAAAAGIGDYFEEVHEQHYPRANVDTEEQMNQVFGLFAEHERALSGAIEEYLTSKPGVRLAGRGGAARRERVGVFSFTVNGRDSREIAEALRADKIGIHADDFYAARCIDALGARPQNGVVRASLVHYNAAQDVECLIAGLDRVI